MRVKRVLLMIGAVAALLAPRAQTQEPSAAKRDAAWVDQRVAEWQPTKAERAFDQIAWVADLREAKRLAQQHRRPIFLFTYDGARLACYRC
jgi:hypothetical protein